jgi:hypothetical protein
MDDHFSYLKECVPRSLPLADPVRDRAVSLVAGIFERIQSALKLPGPPNSFIWPLDRPMCITAAEDAETLSSDLGHNLTEYISNTREGGECLDS